MPLLTVLVSSAMFDAVKRHAKVQSKARGPGRRVTMGDVVTAALRMAGFENDDVLQKLEAGEVVDIDVRRRTPSYRIVTPVMRVRAYLEAKGCSRPWYIKTNLHMSMHDVRRGINAALDAGVAHEKPFDRPRIIHWTARCQCAVALAPDDKPRRLALEKARAVLAARRLEARK